MLQIVGRGEEGIDLGVVKGIDLGVVKGKLEDAGKMLTKGFSISDICDITGLSVEQIEELKIKQKDDNDGGDKK